MPINDNAGFSSKFSRGPSKSPFFSNPQVQKISKGLAKLGLKNLLALGVLLLLVSGAAASMALVRLNQDVRQQAAGQNPYNESCLDRCRRMGESEQYCATECRTCGSLGGVCRPGSSCKAEGTINAACGSGQVCCTGEYDECFVPDTHGCTSTEVCIDGKRCEPTRCGGWANTGPSCTTELLSCPEGTVNIQLPSSAQNCLCLNNGTMIPARSQNSDYCTSPPDSLETLNEHSPCYVFKDGKCSHDTNVTTRSECYAKGGSLGEYMCLVNNTYGNCPSGTELYVTQQGEHKCQCPNSEISLSVNSVDSSACIPSIGAGTCPAKTTRRTNAAGDVFCACDSDSNITIALNSPNSSACPPAPQPCQSARECGQTGDECIQDPNRLGCYIPDPTVTLPTGGTTTPVTQSQTQAQQQPQPDPELCDAFDIARARTQCRNGTVKCVNRQAICEPDPVPITNSTLLTCTAQCGTPPCNCPAGCVSSVVTLPGGTCGVRSTRPTEVQITNFTIDRGEDQPGTRPNSTVTTTTNTNTTATTPTQPALPACRYDQARLHDGRCCTLGRQNCTERTFTVWTVPFCSPVYVRPGDVIPAGVRDVRDCSPVTTTTTNRTVQEDRAPAPVIPQTQTSPTQPTNPNAFSFDRGDTQTARPPRPQPTTISQVQTDAQNAQAESRPEYGPAVCKDLYTCRRLNKTTGYYENLPDVLMCLGQPCNPWPDLPIDESDNVDEGPIASDFDVINIPAEGADCGRAQHGAFICADSTVCSRCVNGLYHPVSDRTHCAGLWCGLPPADLPAPVNTDGECVFGARTCAEVGRYTSTTCNSCPASAAVCCGVRVPDSARMCVPFSSTCSNNAVSVCKADGTGYTQPTNCAEGWACLGDRCQRVASTVAEVQSLPVTQVNQSSSQHEVIRNYGSGVAMTTSIISTVIPDVTFDEVAQLYMSENLIQTRGEVQGTTMAAHQQILHDYGFEVQILHEYSGGGDLDQLEEDLQEYMAAGYMVVMQAEYHPSNGQSVNQYGVFNDVETSQFIGTDSVYGQDLGWTLNCTEAVAGSICPNSIMIVRPESGRG